MKYTFFLAISLVWSNIFSQNPTEIKLLYHTFGDAECRFHHIDTIQIRRDTVTVFDMDFNDETIAIVEDTVSVPYSYDQLIDQKKIIKATSLLSEVLHLDYDIQLIDTVHHNTDCLFIPSNNSAIQNNILSPLLLPYANDNYIHIIIIDQNNLDNSAFRGSIDNPNNNNPIQYIVIPNNYLQDIKTLLHELVHTQARGLSDFHITQDLLIYDECSLDTHSNWCMNLMSKGEGPFSFMFTELQVNVLNGSVDQCDNNTYRHTLPDLYSYFIDHGTFLNESKYACCEINKSTKILKNYCPTNPAQIIDYCLTTANHIDTKTIYEYAKTKLYNDIIGPSFLSEAKYLLQNSTYNLEKYAYKRYDNYIHSIENRLVLLHIIYDAEILHQKRYESDVLKGISKKSLEAFYDDIYMDDYMAIENSLRSRDEFKPEVYSEDIVFSSYIDWKKFTLYQRFLFTYLEKKRYIQTMELYYFNKYGIEIEK